MNRYAVSSLIGEGSFGRVYKAVRKEDKETVAIKIISKRGRSNKELKNIRRECDIQAHLKHPNVIEMFESFETKNDLVVVTEFSLIDLHRYLSRNGSISEQSAQKLTCHLVSALYYLHSNRILHRDLKPQNVLLNKELHAKLCDFGLARNMTMGTHVLTSIKGTPLYMAPELLAERPYDHQADLWSLGCIAYETMAGQPPFCTTSILHLVKMIKHEEVKWPSFLSSHCRSFLQGLLEKDPSLRSTWAQILCHPFVEGKLLVSGISADNSPFINPGKNTGKSFKNNPAKKEVASNMDSFKHAIDPDCVVDNLTSSRDSTNAIPPSDIENIETDIEDCTNRLTVPFSEEHFKTKDHTDQLETTPTSDQLPESIASAILIDDSDNLCFVTGDTNMIVNHLNDNFKLEETVYGEEKSNSNDPLSMKEEMSVSDTKISNHTARVKDLEKRKLSQNLDNFSLRLGQSIDTESMRKTTDVTVQKKEKVSTGNHPSQSIDEKQSFENSPPNLLPGWDSCDESQSPPIENEEWLAFLNRSIQEILDGELDSLTQQNLVSIIVAPLRNTKASAKVIESVAQLLSLPLVLRAPASIIESIIMVYIEVKLVPNLMYASKLLMSSKNTEDSTASLQPSISSRTMRQLDEMNSEEIRTASQLYELICHLVHLNHQFLSQFCDAVAILAANDLLINFLNHDFENANAIRISNNVIALMCCVLCELPENADIVEKIAFNSKLNLVSLLRNDDELLRTRMCMLIRLLARFSLRGLQNIWNVEIKETIESLAQDECNQIREEAEAALEELKEFSFYA